MTSTCRHTSHRTAIIATFLMAFNLTAATAVAGPIEDILSLISQDQYTTYVFDKMYTHMGHNRGFGPEHDLARDFLEDEYTSFGLDVSLFPFIYDGSTYYNVVAVQEGVLNPDQIYIIGGHYDSVNNPGADDNASGTVGALEVARVLSRFDFDSTIIYIGFDREEQGLHGSWAYANAHSNDDIRGMISLDMIAYNPNARNEAMIYGQSQSTQLKNNLAAAFSLYAPAIHANIGGRSRGSDHYPFEQNGFQACLLIEEGYWLNPHYHQLTDSVDTPNYMDYEFATSMTKAVAGWLIEEAGLLSLVHSEPDPGVAGVSNDLKVSGCMPGSRTYFVYGFNAGSTAVPVCSGVTVDIGDPVVAGSVMANTWGDAVLTRHVPNAASGRTVRLQAVEPDSCKTSNLVTFSFP